MQKNILIIERDFKICKFLKYGIAAAGHHAYYCLTGREGLIHLMKGHYNLLILELEMEGISGREILQITRSREAVPILVISSSNDIQTKVEAFQLGADDYGCSGGSACTDGSPMPKVREGTGKNQSVRSILRWVHD